ncbi:hypothetical protein [Streptomyces adustus]|uniref:hypothetical protein n=1 Tax=Streptomyces adustus TaxID=1609272 RepID=UPI003710F930
MAAVSGAAEGGALVRAFHCLGRPVYQRIEELFRCGHRRVLLQVPLELPCEITRGALERLFISLLPHQLDRSAADLLRATVDSVPHGVIRSVDAIGEERGTNIRAVPGNDREVNP